MSGAECRWLFYLDFDVGYVNLNSIVIEQ